MSFNLSQMLQKLKLDELDDNQNLFFIRKYLGVKPSSFLIALITFVIIVALTSNATGIVVSLTCGLIPVYFTFLALQTSSPEDDIKYLMYWILFAGIQLISPVLSMVLSSFLYIFLRIGLTIVLLHPSLNMTVKFYRTCVEPELKKWQNSIDAQLERGKTVAQDQYKRFARN